MRPRKGIFGEELPATMMTVILLFIFMAASISMYTGFFQKMGIVERERAASSVTEFIFFSGLKDTASIMAIVENRTGIMLTLTDLETRASWSMGSIENASSASVSSVPIMLYNSTEGRMHLARVDAYVGE